MTVRISAADWDQTMPYIPTSRLSRNSMGILKTSHRIIPKNRDFLPIPKAWKR